MKRILSTLAQKWPEYLLEILVITIGIYGAFALDNWNENRKKEAAKNALLHNLNEEFKANLSKIDTVLYYDGLSAKSSIYLMDLIKTKKILSEKKMDSIFLHLYYSWTYDPSMGVLRSAVSSGEIHLIKNKLLLNHLFSWEDLVKDAKENEERFIGQHLKSIPEFFDRIQFANSFGFYEKRIPKSHYHSDYSAVLDDPLFENYLANKLLWLLDAEGELLAVRARIVEIIDLLEQE